MKILMTLENDDGSAFRCDLDLGPNMAAFTRQDLRGGLAALIDFRDGLPERRASMKRIDAILAGEDI